MPKAALMAVRARLGERRADCRGPAPDDFSTGLSVVIATTPLCRTKQQPYSCIIQSVKRSRRDAHEQMFRKKNVNCCSLSWW